MTFHEATIPSTIFKHKYSHIGVPTTKHFDREIHLTHLKMTVNNHKESPFGLQLMRFETNADFPNSVLTLPHVAFEVDCLDEILKGFKVIIPPNSPSTGLRVAFIEVNGLPIELMEYSVEAIPEHGPMEGRTGYCLNGNAIRFVSLSIPSCSPHIKDWIDVPELSMRKSGSCNGENPFGTQWVKFFRGTPLSKANC